MTSVNMLVEEGPVNAKTIVTLVMIYTIPPGKGQNKERHIKAPAEVLLVQPNNQKETQSNINGAAVITTLDSRQTNNSA